METTSMASFTTNQPNIGFNYDDLWRNTSCYEMGLAGKSFMINYYHFPPEFFLNAFYKQHNYVLKFYLSPLVGLLGILMNLTFLFVLARVPDMRTVTNVYLGSLAVADTMFLTASAVDLLKTWQSNTGLLLNHPYYTNAQCVSFNLSIKLTFYGSVCMITLVAFERYMAICHPLKHRMVSGKRYTIKVTVVTWLVAVIMGTLGCLKTVRSNSYCFLWPPGLKEMAYVYIGDDRTVCNALSPIWWAVSHGMQSVFFAANLCLNILLYCSIIRRLGKRNVGGEGNQERQRELQRVQNQVAKMLIINGTVFFILMVPYEINTFVEFIWTVTWHMRSNGEATAIRNLEFYGTCLRFINSALNPLIYGLSNSRYRQAYRKAFGCARKERKQPTSVDNKAAVLTASTNNI
ncbi:growth hormone secretagogue receptor type 1-like [Amphiura filiformis]|uniref:growth hormone secretagogue receptor type 1-like n=1 Tax=Amphiura filiformis TaxID=82378 RepID=UPI003B2246A6